ncbi:MAG: PQQ-dependent sugar dehydrogenase [Myxococcales bacterium]|nr:PQQ-dependent sugar dehydrogenase [Myxococcales bacterium]
MRTPLIFLVTMPPNKRIRILLTVFLVLALGAFPVRDWLLRSIESPSPAMERPEVPERLPEGIGDWVKHAQLDGQITGIRAVPDSPTALWVMLRDGRIFRVQGSGETTLIVDYREFVNDRGGEQGLLDVVFDPRDAARCFVHYTGERGQTVIEAWRLPGVADTVIALVQPQAQLLFAVEQPYPNHNGGQLQMGSDGWLYVGLGDGGSGGDPQNRAQNMATPLGKLLRLNVTTAGMDAAGAPSPLLLEGSGEGVPDPWRASVPWEIVALGLRNPWRFSFGVAEGSNDLWIADVGQNRFEEVNHVPADALRPVNLGWRLMEGSHEYPGGALPSVPNDALMGPIHSYRHGPQGCSITGGVMVTRGVFAGVWIFSDFCSGRVDGIRRTPDGEYEWLRLWNTPWPVTAFALDGSGRLFVGSLDGQLHWLDETAG